MNEERDAMYVIVYLVIAVTVVVIAVTASSIVGILWLEWKLIMR